MLQVEVIPEMRSSSYQKAVLELHELLGAHVFLHGIIVRHDAFAIRSGLKARPSAGARGRTHN